MDGVAIDAAWEVALERRQPLAPLPFDRLALRHHLAPSPLLRQLAEAHGGRGGADDGPVVALERRQHRAPLPLESLALRHHLAPSPLLMEDAAVQTMAP